MRMKAVRAAAVQAASRTRHARRSSSTSITPGIGLNDRRDVELSMELQKQLRRRFHVEDVEKHPVGLVALDRCGDDLVARARLVEPPSGQSMEHRRP